jgi:HlyD family secretion protein
MVDLSNAPGFGRARPAAAPAPMSSADPARDVRRGMIIALLFFGLFLGWAAVARLDAAVNGEGRVITSGQRQVIQHPIGGVVETVLVKEGERVRKGQLLLTLVGTEGRAQVAALRSQAAHLLAQRERLVAELAGRHTLERPAEFAGWRPEEQVEAGDAVRQQQDELAARLVVLAAQEDASSSRVAQSGLQAQALDRQRDSAEEQNRLLQHELDLLAPVAAKGFVPQTRIRQLERTRAELRGRRDELAVEASRAREGVNEGRVQRLAATGGFRERANAELREVETSLGEVLPKLGAAREAAARNEVRSPVDGAIIGLATHTKGGTVGPGQRLMEVVPAHGALVIEARFTPVDIDDLRDGQAVLIRLPGFHPGSMKDIRGRLEQLSADSLTDERTGAAYYRGEIRVSPEAIAAARADGEQAPRLKPGMPAEVVVRLRRRSVLQYAIEPILGGFD